MSLTELLGTPNEKEQEEKVKALIQTVSTPVIDLLIRYDASTDRASIHIIGDDVAFDVIHRMLELAGKAMRKEEIQTALTQQQQVDSENLCADAKAYE